MFAAVTKGAIRAACCKIMNLNREMSVLGQFAIQLNAIALRVIQIGSLGHKVISWMIAVFQRPQTCYNARQFTPVSDLVARM